MASKRIPSATSQRPRSGTVLQEIFARKRETEQIRSEKNSAVAQYYDKWGRITSRFENWTTPEYYEKTDQQLRREEEERRKAELLEQRREKLRDLLTSEREEFERELKAKERNKLRPSSAGVSAAKHDVDVLQRLNASLSEQERRRKEIEGKLYSRWRFGMTRDELILESKSHHQAMAKLNWLDQQVEEQLERDRERKEREVLEMQRKSEMLREEEVALEAKQSREREIAQLRKTLEFHVAELRVRESQSKALKEQSRELEDVRLNLEMKSQEVLKMFEARKGGNQIPMHNLRRLKVLAREHCRAVEEEVSEDLHQLREIRAILNGDLVGGKEEQHFQLLTCKFEQELKDLQTVSGQFMTMYDSEVKGVLIKQQTLWRENEATRKRLLKNFVQEFIDKCDTITGCNRDEIGSLIAIKESHLKSIEDLQEKLELVTGENKRRANSGETFLNGGTEQKPTAMKATNMQQQPATFMSLGEQLEGMRLAVDNNVAAEKCLTSPRFGRKKVAWC